MKWKLVPVEPTQEMLDAGVVSRNHAVSWPGIANFTYSAMLEAAPNPPVLSDERILEIWAGNSGRPVTMGKYRIIAQARAIEREILGGGE